VTHMRYRRSTYIFLLILVVALGSLGISGVYPKLLGAMFFLCLLLLFGGMLRETSNKIE